MNQPMNTFLIVHCANQDYNNIGPEITKTVKVHVVY